MRLREKEERFYLSHGHTRTNTMTTREDYYNIILLLLYYIINTIFIWIWSAFRLWCVNTLTRELQLNAVYNN